LFPPGARLTWSRRKEADHGNQPELRHEAALGVGVAKVRCGYK